MVSLCSSNPYTQIVYQQYWPEQRLPLVLRPRPQSTAVPLRCTCDVCRLADAGDDVIKLIGEFVFRPTLLWVSRRFQRLVDHPALHKRTHKVAYYDDRRFRHTTREVCAAYSEAGLRTVCARSRAACPGLMQRVVVYHAQILADAVAATEHHVFDLIWETIANCEELRALMLVARSCTRDRIVDLRKLGEALLGKNAIHTLKLDLPNVKAQDQAIGSCAGGLRARCRCSSRCSGPFPRCRGSGCWMWTPASPKWAISGLWWRR